MSNIAINNLPPANLPLQGTEVFPLVQGGITVQAALNNITVTGSAVLSPGANINGVLFTGASNIVVTAAAGTLTGTTLASNVVTSSLTSIGTITTGVWNAGAVTSSGAIISTGTGLTNMFSATFDGLNGNVGYNVGFSSSSTVQANNPWVGFATQGIALSGTSYASSITGVNLGGLTFSNNADNGTVIGVAMNGAVFSNGANADSIIGLKMQNTTFSGTSSTSGFAIVQGSMPVITSTSGSFGNLFGINIFGASVTGSANPQCNINVINIGSATYGGVAASVPIATGINIGNQGGLGANNSYALNIISQSTSTNSSYAIKCDDGFRVRSSAGTGKGAVIVGTAALATTATDGFLWIPSCAGVPTGNATAPYSNAVALVYDTTDNKLYVSPNGGGTWKSATFT